MNGLKMVMTVNGPLSPEELGVTLMHEHLLVDPYRRRREADEAISRAKLRSSGEQDVLNDLALITEEVTEFKKEGGSALVDLTSIGLGRDPLGIKAVSDATGLHIVAGAGYFLDMCMPWYVRDATVEQLAEHIVKELTEGMSPVPLPPDTYTIKGQEEKERLRLDRPPTFPGLRAGIIGEVGTSERINPAEVKSVRASCYAHHRTGAAIAIHPYSYSEEGQRQAYRTLDLIVEEDVDLRRVIMCHAFNDRGQTLEYRLELASRGVNLAYDTFGMEKPPFPEDKNRVADIARIVEKGYVQQIVLSQDICFKSCLKKYGGRGYAHISRNIKPMLCAVGLTDREINTMMVENPGRILPFEPP